MFAALYMLLTKDLILRRRRFCVSIMQIAIPILIIWLSLYSMRSVEERKKEFSTELGKNDRDGEEKQVKYKPNFVNTYYTGFVINDGTQTLLRVWEDNELEEAEMGDMNTSFGGIVKVDKMEGNQYNFTRIHDSGTDPFTPQLISQVLDESDVHLFSNPKRVELREEPFSDGEFFILVYLPVVFSALMNARIVLDSILYERETGLFENLKLFGMLSRDYYLSIFLSSTVVNLVIVSLMAAVYSYFKFNEHYWEYLWTSFLFLQGCIPFLLSAAVLIRSSSVLFISGVCLLAQIPLFRTVSPFVDFRNTDTYLNTYGTCFYQGVIPMLLQLFGYWALYMYLDQVLPQKFGQPLPFYFPFMPSYWVGSEKKKTLERANTPIEQDAMHIQPPSAAEQVLIDQGECVELMGLTKRFGDFTAVNNVSFVMIPGETTVLLGGNGSGKTTTSRLLTGIYPATSGTAKVFGYDVATDLVEVRKLWGLCQQENIMWRELTVNDHIRLFGILLGLSGAVLKESKKSVLADVMLTHKTKALSSQLSGGMQRRLSLAIAFLGHPKAVFLDEPTSGIDPFSRRGIWAMINARKQDKAVCISTHFLDEAEILADKISIMSLGQLKAFGTPIFLKRAFNCGYTVTVVKHQGQRFNSSAVLQLATNQCNSVTIKSDSTDSLALTVPLDQSGQIGQVLVAVRSNPNVKEVGVTFAGIDEVFTKVTPVLSIEDAADTVVGNQTWLSQFTAVFVRQLFSMLRSYVSVFATFILPVLVILGCKFAIVKYDAPQSLKIPENALQGRGLVFGIVPGNFTDDEVTKIKSSIPGVEWKDMESSDDCRKYNFAIFKDDKYDTSIWSYKYYIDKRSSYKKEDDAVLPEDKAKFLREKNEHIVLYNKNFAVFGSDSTAMVYHTIASKMFKTERTFYAKSQIFSVILKAVSEVVMLIAMMIPGFSILSRLFDFRKTGFKQFLYFSGMKVSAFWVASFTLDFFSIFVAGLLAYGTSCLVFDNMVNSALSVVFFLTGFSFTLVTLIYFLDAVLRNYTINNILLLLNLLLVAGISFYIILTSSLLGQSILFVSHVDILIRRVASSALEYVVLHSGGHQAFNLILPQIWWLPIPFKLFPQISFMDAFLKSTDKFVPVPKLDTAIHNLVDVINKNYVEEGFLMSRIFWNTIRGGRLGLEIFKPDSLPAKLVQLVGIVGIFQAPYLFDTTEHLKSFGKTMERFFKGKNRTKIQERKHQEREKYRQEHIEYLRSAGFTDAQIQNMYQSGGRLDFWGLLDYGLKFLHAIFDEEKSDLFRAGICTVDWKELAKEDDIAADDLILATVKVFEIFKEDETVQFPDLLFRLGYFAMDILVKGITVKSTIRFHPFDLWYSLLLLSCYGLVYFLVSILAEFSRENPMLRRLLTCRSRKEVAGRVARVARTDEEMGLIEPNVVTGNNAAVLAVTDVSRVFKGFKAVDGVSFQIRAGEIFVLLGINGAGKTTTFKMCLCDELPDSGKVSICGEDIEDRMELSRSKLGYCAQQDLISENTTVREHIELMGRLRGLSVAVAKSECTRIMNLLLVAPFQNKPAGVLSGGNKRKLCVGMAIIGNPLAVLLDEPTSGMDPVARRYLWKVLQHLAEKESRAILLTTHVMEEAEALGNPIAIMAKGQVRCNGTLPVIKSQFGIGFEVTFFGMPVEESKILGQIQGMADTLTKAQAMTAFNTSTAEQFDTEFGATTTTVNTKYFVNWFLTNQANQGIDNWAKRILPGTVRRVSCYGRMSKYSVTNCMEVIEIFKAIEAHKGEIELEDFAVSQYSLEHIFNLIAESAATAA
jgi:ABC-type multidrug transport system ATPase subunit